MQYFAWWVSNGGSIKGRIKDLSLEAVGLLAALREQAAQEEAEEGLLDFMGRGDDLRFVAHYFRIPYLKFMKLIKKLEVANEIGVKKEGLVLIRWAGDMEHLYERRAAWRKAQQRKRDKAKDTGGV